MPLSPEAAAARANELLKMQRETRSRLDPVRRYWKGRQALPPIIPKSAPVEVREMARISRVNVVEIVVASLVQSLIVEGLRAEEQDDNGDPVDVNIDPIWRVLQANRWDKRQAGVHAAAVAYGHAYTVVPAAPAERVIVRGVSPRKMTALYGDDPDWPVETLESRGAGRYEMYDDEALYRLSMSTGDRLITDTDGISEHRFGHPPVVRYDAEDDLDEDDEPASALSGRLSGPPPIDIVAGQVAPLVSLQDQIDVITFNLMVAQHYTAFRQRYIIGWTDVTEQNAMKAAASTVWTFKDHPDDMSIGEFGETTLKGYIDSREQALKYAATLSQTPVHELIGQMINMAADALAAAEAGRDRRVDMLKIALGESHEQTAGLIGQLVGAEVPDDAEIIWRDTSARAFTVVIQGLAMLATQLGIPPSELWDRVPGMTQQDIRRFKAAAAEGDSLANLTALLDRQTVPAGPAPAGETVTDSGIILPQGAAA